MSRQQAGTHGIGSIGDDDDDYSGGGGSGGVGDDYYGGEEEEAQVVQVVMREGPNPASSSTKVPAGARGGRSAARLGGSGSGPEYAPTETQFHQHQQNHNNQHHHHYQYHRSEYHRSDHSQARPSPPPPLPPPHPSASSSSTSASSRPYHDRRQSARLHFHHPNSNSTSTHSSRGIGRSHSPAPSPRSNAFSRPHPPPAAAPPAAAPPAVVVVGRARANSSAAAPPRTSSLLPPPRSANANARAISPVLIQIRPTDEGASTPTSLHHTTATPAAARTPTLAQGPGRRQLPPSNVDTAHSPAVESSATFLLDPLNTPGFPGRSISRASSAGAVSLSEGFRNLNRWSSSTTSSRVSAWDHLLHQPPPGPPPPPPPLPSHSQPSPPQRLAELRRASVDSVALFAQGPTAESSDPLANLISQGSTGSGPSSTVRSSSRNKLSKRRPSDGLNASPDSRTRSALAGGAPARSRRSPSPPPPSRVVQPPNLPPIVALSPLATGTGASLALDSPNIMSRASPGLTTPNSVFSSPHHGEPNDFFWTDLANPSRNASPITARANPTLLPPASVKREDEPERKGHTRGRSSAANGSSSDSTKKDRSGKPSQKAMLSKALSKANNAVQLDNAQKYENARECYVDACLLLQQVLARTNGEDDRKKLEAIRRTYTSRIEDLEGLVRANAAQNDKALPHRPDSIQPQGVLVDVASAVAAGRRPSRTEPSPISFRRPSEPTTVDFSRYAATPAPEQYPLQSSFSRSPVRRNFEGASLTIPRGNDAAVPAPLSPRRLVSSKAPSPDPIVRQDFSMAAERLSAPPEMKSHRRNLSHESGSWLDPIDESGGSASSSMHSRSSSRIRGRHARNASGATEAEFDAALDAAVEAAYDDGYEAAGASVRIYDEDTDAEDRIASTMRRVELARERVRQTEREAAIEFARERERQRQVSAASQESHTFGGDFFDANDSDEEEERMLEAMTRGYVTDGYTSGQQPRYQSNLPRESDSSGITTRTWHSSMGSNPPTATTVLSTVTEMPPATKRKPSPPTLPPPPQALPQPPPGRPGSASGVRTRRISGQNLKQLKIETSKLSPPPGVPPQVITTSAVQQKPPSGFIAQQRRAMSATSTRSGPFSMRRPSSPSRGISPADAFGPTSPPTEDEPRTGSPSSVRGGVRKNFSSSSLKSLSKTRQLSVSQVDDADASPHTPLTQQISYGSFSRQPALPSLPTPIAAAFGEKAMMSGVGGLHLFDSDFHSPGSHSPNTLHQHQLQNPEVPLPLEPCPADAMLRPFWLMRALYQTLAHPRGGYVSNKLFVPRDAWKVKGVKLRALDDKISQCDLLTAALLKLARVDSNDADAVLEEMQSLESILEMVQAVLVRRLGGDVGTQGISTLRDDKDTEAAPPVPRNNSISGKGGAFSWRRLRNKGSAVNMASAYGGKTNSNGGNSGPTSVYERETTTSSSGSGGSVPSLPMTAHPSSRPAKRDVASVKFDGPYAHYMASLARLFDAAQTVDQIARQVEDPGLRHADKTQVGLELCTRHAAEFFAFYICRFVLADLGLLLDKFVKRGSEWVLN
ncbi:hypothetical protein GGR56DRAFT_659924 [Xylariaceae sp. FL0804]|nr:hypothetical protein GGR56DRAFT_659924 [Xylariaceae sp. FL0804]